MKKKIIIIWIVLIAFVHESKSQEILPGGTLNVCYGEEIVFQLNNYYENDQIEWLYSYDESGPYNLLSENTETFLMKTEVFEKSDIYIISKINGNFHTEVTKITFVPDIEFDIHLPDLICAQHTLVFAATSEQEDLLFKWFINNLQIPYAIGDDIEFFAKESGEYILKVIAQNQLGCTMEKDTIFFIDKKPEVNLTLSNIACSKGLSKIELNGEIENSFIRDVICFINGNSFDDFEIIEINKNDVLIKWGETNINSQLEFSVVFETDNGCQFVADSELLLLKDKAPEAGTIFRKSPGSNLLIYDDKELNTEGVLSYSWGFNFENDYSYLGAPNQPYALYPNINSSTTYWVDISFMNNNFCKTRTVYTGDFDSEYKLDIQSVIYPNPADNFINIRLTEQAEEIKIDFYDMEGVLVKSLKEYVSGTDLKIDVSGLIRGSYNIRLVTDQFKNYSETLIINK
jgi:hypothetical protein